MFWSAISLAESIFYSSSIPPYFFHAPGSDLAPALLHGLSEPERGAPVLKLDSWASLKLVGGLLFDIFAGRPLSPEDDSVRNCSHCVCLITTYMHSLFVNSHFTAVFLPNTVQFEPIRGAVNDCWDLAWVIRGLLRHRPEFPLESLSQVHDLAMFAEDPWMALVNKNHSLADIESNMTGVSLTVTICYCHDCVCVVPPRCGRIGELLIL